MTRREFEARAVVSLALLERLTGIERRQLRRHLKSNSVQLKRSGNRHVLHRIALRRHLPDLYQAILEKLKESEAPGLDCRSEFGEAGDELDLGCEDEID
jgi:hypothetical protein